MVTNTLFIKVKNFSAKAGYNGIKISNRTLKTEFYNGFK